MTHPLRIIYRYRVLFALLPMVLLVLFYARLTAQSPLGGEVHGSVQALIRGQSDFPNGKTTDPHIFLPDVSVYLQNTATSATSPLSTTDLDGTFMIPAQPQAVYRLCWKADGYVSGCDTKTFVLRGRNVNLQPVSVEAKRGVVFGKVTLNDNRPCRFVAPFVGVNTSTVLTAQPAGAVPVVRANSYGEYVYPALLPGPVKITAACENANVSAVRNIIPSGAIQNDMLLPNMTPTIGVAYATSAGHVVRAVAPGTTVDVTVEARDGGGFPLHYQWAVDPPVAGFVSQDAPTVKWTVSGSGLATIYVVARDHNGGNALGRVKLSTTPNEITFSGKITANDAPLVQDADVTINGVSTKTNTQGQFLIVLPKEELRYVITVEKLGYQMLSRNLYAPATGSVFKLYRSQDFLVDPRLQIDITERANTAGTDQKGVRIIIPPNSIAAGLDGKGPLATGILHIRPASYNLNDPNDTMPGDYGGIDSAGHQFRLSTFGSADVQIHDAAGHRYNLVPGKTATVQMPIHPAMLAAAPAAIPFWHYDSKQGVWLRDGAAMRVGNSYEAQSAHFSAVNMDLANSDGACTRIVVDTGIMPVPFRIRMTPLTGNFVVDAGHQDQVIGDGLNVVVREPPNTTVQFDMVDSDGNVIPNASQTITTGLTSASGAMWDPAPNPPYLDCTSEVRYDVHTVQALFPVPPQGFLSYRTPPAYLDPLQAPALAADYYNRIDPGHQKTAPGDTNDFAHWKTINGFDRPGETHTIYQNQYDLGFGRDMHMQTGGQNGLCANCIAYYVTNFETVEKAVSPGPSDQKATVAMEFSPQNNVSGIPYTKFYVFNPDGSITNSVALDDFGPKFVPTLCIICHNGNINSMGADGNLTTSRFIPFDLESFRFHPTDPNWSQATQEPRFKEMNRGILDHTNASAPVRLVITHWYGTEGDTGLPNPTFDATAVPSQWTSPTNQAPLYNAVVKTSCRSCHTTRDPGDTGQDISWQSYDSLDQESKFARILACTATGPLHHIMPQAERTFARFWLSTNPNGPLVIANSALSGFQMPNNSCQ